jgi:expansin (peptidoglycan-binding protein)
LGSCVTRHIPDAGKSVTVTVTDECPSCKPGDVDLSPAAFKKLASLDQGRIAINWKFL